MKPVPFSPPWQISSPASEAPKILSPDAAGQIPIIIAEDDPISREVMSSLVSKWGFPGVITQDGHEAMAAIRAQPEPVLAILDWMMPGMDGMEVCRRIRASEKTVYIIMLTARGSKENIVEGLGAGADDYLVKPFDKDELLARIRVGFRILSLHKTLTDKVAELAAALAELKALKLQVPL
jgi:DNA-binding response OmpR family regulator